MKLLMVCLLLSFGNIALADAGEREYGIHLFFDEKEFVDTLYLEQSLCETYLGRMVVPNDFEATIEKARLYEGLKIRFEVLVPKNSARPEDLVFEYEGQFFDSSHNQLTGFVKIRGREGFIASFVGFARN